MAKSKEEIEREEKERADAARVAHPPGPPKPAPAKADKARAAMLGAKRYVIVGASVGAHLKRAVVGRTEIANFTRDPSRAATEDEVTAGIARLVDKGAIVPAPDDEDDE